MTRIKEDIIRDVMTKITLDRSIASNLVESLLKNLKAPLASGEDVLISGFGEFRVRHKKARLGRNPITKVEYEISERNVVTFYPSKVFRKEMSAYYAQTTT
jgi:integration host factor subunit alpha